MGLLQRCFDAQELFLELKYTGEARIRYMTLLNRALIVGCVTGFVAILVSLALMHESSPFYQDSLRPGFLRSIWQLVNAPAVIVLIASRSLAAGTLVLFVQWFLIGLITTLGFAKLRKRFARKIDLQR